MVKVYKPPEIVDIVTSSGIKIFLAGSIEMGKAEMWQDEVVEFLTRKNYDKDIVILNPRRDNWDPSWEQSIENEKFKFQVNWELNGLDHCDILFFYFQPGTISPVTMFELGYCINNEPIVVCPEGFHRKGNIDIVCERMGIKVYQNLEDGMNALLDEINYL